MKMLINNFFFLHIDTRRHFLGLIVVAGERNTENEKHIISFFFRFNRISNPFGKNVNGHGHFRCEINYFLFFQSFLPGKMRLYQLLVGEFIYL